MTLALAQRRGMALPLVMVLVTLAGIAIFVFQRVVQQEAYGTHKLVRTLQAEAICDRVVNRLSAVVGQHPWEDRFYLLGGLAGRALAAATERHAGVHTTLLWLGRAAVFGGLGSTLVFVVMYQQAVQENTFLAGLPEMLMMLPGLRRPLPVLRRISMMIAALPRSSP